MVTGKAVENVAVKLLQLAVTELPRDVKEALQRAYREEENDAELGHRNTGRYSYPGFYFTVTIDDVKATSGTLRVSDDLEIELKDDHGDAVADEEYVAYLASGEVRKGKLDKDGKATEKDVPPTKNQVVFPNQKKTNKIPR